MPKVSIDRKIIEINTEIMRLSNAWAVAISALQTCVQTLRDSVNSGDAAFRRIRKHLDAIEEATGDLLADPANEFRALAVLSDKLSELLQKEPFTGDWIKEDLQKPVNVFSRK